MRKTEIISRIKDIVRDKRTNGELKLMSYPDQNRNNSELSERSLWIRNDHLYYTINIHKGNVSSAYNYKDVYMYKHTLAAILFEIGTPEDRSLVKESMALQDYAVLSNRLGLFNPN